MRQVGIDLLVGIDPLKLTFLGPKFSPAAQKKTKKFRLRRAFRPNRAFLPLKFLPAARFPP